ncbi:MAG: hypothetical protein WD601_09305 [Pseudohongiellaceae bacterium]
MHWTLTADGDKQAGQVVVHCTINQPRADADFIESLEQFVHDWKVGLEAWQERLQELISEPHTLECTPWYG